MELSRPHVTPVASGSLNLLNVFPYLMIKFNHHLVKGSYFYLIRHLRCISTMKNGLHLSLLKLKWYLPLWKMFSAGSCGVPPAVSNSNVHLTDRFITKTSFFSGQKVYYNCDVGYVAAGGRKSRFCNNGIWTPLKLKCQRKYIWYFFLIKSFYKS